ncbi:phage minor head protein [Halomonas sp. H5]|uniref:phage minor head protein n=1 Tax=Halomonas sp. H5 TaxID=3423910 RepID=UPI003D362E26
MLSRIWRLITRGSSVAPSAEAPEPRAERHQDERKRQAAKQKEKQVSAGITHYRWSSAGDERVCENCRANDGKIFSWNDPPQTGHPGEVKCCTEKSGCRCVAAPLLPWEVEESQRKR